MKIMFNLVKQLTLGRKLLNKGPEGDTGNYINPQLAGCKIEFSGNITGYPDTGRFSQPPCERDRSL